VDIWAIGCIFFELIYFRPAFSNDFAVLRHGLKEMELEIPLNTVKEIFPDDISTDSAIGLLDAMFEIDPANRPSAQVILSKLTAIFDVKIDFQSIDQSTVDISTRLNDMTLSQSAEEPIEVGAFCIVVSDHSGIPQGCKV
jgi:serine/threonine protein kinase